MPAASAGDRIILAISSGDRVRIWDVSAPERPIATSSVLLGEPVVLPGAGGAHPEIFTVTLDPKKSRSAEYLKGTFFWHIDGATDDVPTRGTLLSARSLADEGGDTEFAGTYAAWEALPGDERGRLGSAAQTLLVRPR